MVKICGKEGNPDLTADEIKTLQKLTGDNSVEDLEMLFSLAIENAEGVHKSSFQELSLESMVIKLATTRNSVPINEIMGKITSLAKKISGETSTETGPGPETEKAPSKTVKETKPEPKYEDQPEEPPHTVESENIDEEADAPQAETVSKPAINRDESFMEFVKKQNASKI